MARPKQIRLPILPAGGNLFNVSSVSLNRAPEGRADHWRQGCLPIASGLWRQWAPTGPSVASTVAVTVMQLQVAPGNTAAHISAASAAGTVTMMREPETLTGIEYCRVSPPVSVSRRSNNTPLNEVPSH
jgi:hypothetical protein